MTQRLIFNYWLDAAVTGALAVMVLVLLVEAIGEWIAILRGRKAVGAARIHICRDAIRGRRPKLSEENFKWQGSLA